jgi:hypothetical protein
MYTFNSGSTRILRLVLSRLILGVPAVLILLGGLADPVQAQEPICPETLSISVAEEEPLQENDGIALLGCNYLIITHDDFYTDILPLAQSKEQKGFLTNVVKTSAIGSSPTAADIAAYIRNIYQNRRPQPLYVLLVGDAKFIPPHYRMQKINGSMVTFATDLYYATMDTIDYLPDLYLGRLPVNSNKEAAGVVDKILNFRSDLNSETVLLVGADFYAKRDEKIIKSDGYAVDTVYSNKSSDPAAAKKVLSKINNGPLAVAHYGHGDVNCWHPFFCMYGGSPKLTNTRLPLMISGGCDTAQFDFTKFNSIGEEMLLSPNGAIAYIGGTKGGGFGYKYAFSEGFFHELGQSARIGQMMYAGLMAAYQAALSDGENVGCGSWTHTFFEKMTLLGDPELILKSYQIAEPPDTPYQFESVMTDQVNP